MFPHPRRLPLPNVTGWWIMIKVTTHWVMWYFDHVVTWGHATNEKRNISVSRKPIRNKCGVIYDMRSLTIKSNDALITWSCDEFHLHIHRRMNICYGKHDWQTAMAYKTVRINCTQEHCSNKYYIQTSHTSSYSLFNPLWHRVLFLRCLWMSL